jgi:hypothetical protein
MVGLPAETFRWKYHNNNTPVEWSVFVWSLIHIIQLKYGIWYILKRKAFDLLTSARVWETSNAAKSEISCFWNAISPLAPSPQYVMIYALLFVITCSLTLTRTNTHPNFPSDTKVHLSCLSYMFQFLFGSSSCHYIKLLKKCKSKNVYKIYILSVISWNYKSSIIVIFLNYIIVVYTVYCAFAKPSITEIKLLKSRYMKSKFPVNWGPLVLSVL